MFFVCILDRDMGKLIYSQFLDFGLICYLDFMLSMLFYLSRMLNRHFGKIMLALSNVILERVITILSIDLT